MGNVQNPVINGSNLFQATNVSQPLQLNWSAPTGLTPSGYEVLIDGFSFPSTCPVAPLKVTFCPEVVSSVRLFTTDTSITLPSGALQDGVQYQFMIHALADGSTDFLKAPHRGSWNRAYSDVISNLITVGSAPVPASTTAVQMNATGTSKHTIAIRDSNGTMHSYSCESEANCTR
jgi:hypothetical protein